MYISLSLSLYIYIYKYIHIYPIKTLNNLNPFLVNAFWCFQGV